jgi:hypothetical protein
MRCPEIRWFVVWDSLIFGCQWKICHRFTDVSVLDVLQVHGKSRIDEQYDEDAAGDRPPGAYLTLVEIC